MEGVPALCLGEESEPPRDPVGACSYSARRETESSRFSAPMSALLSQRCCLKPACAQAPYGWEKLSDTWRRFIVRRDGADQVRPREKQGQNKNKVGGWRTRRGAYPYLHILGSRLAHVRCVLRWSLLLGVLLNV